VALARRSDARRHLLRLQATHNRGVGVSCGHGPCGCVRCHPLRHHRPALAGSACGACQAQAHHSPRQLHALAPAAC
jgi:hypothetical protein